MGVGHAHSLYLEHDSRLHRLAPECKLAAVFAFIFLVVLTPREQFWAFAVYAVLVLALARIGRVPFTTLARRLVVELPFLTFAVAIPFFARGEQTEVLGVSLSISGLYASFNILAKATLGASATIVLGSTTPVRDLLKGLERLRLPRSFVSIAGFMLRYADVIVAEMHRMKIARISRGYDPRNALQAKALGAAAGTLFVRSYERGERVYLAMVSRGYTGVMPDLGAPRAEAAQWRTVAVLPVAAAVVCTAAWLAHA